MAGIKKSGSSGKKGGSIVDALNLKDPKMIIFLIIAVLLIVAVVYLLIPKGSKNPGTTDASYVTRPAESGNSVIDPTAPTDPTKEPTTTTSRIDDATTPAEPTDNTEQSVDPEFVEPDITRKEGNYNTLETAVTNASNPNKVTREEFINVDGVNSAYPIPHMDYEKIPRMSDLEAAVSSGNINWIRGTIVSFSDNNIVSVKTSDDQVLNIHLVGISWASDDGKTITPSFVKDNVAYQFFSGDFESDYVYVEPAEVWENGDGTYNGYVWFSYQSYDFSLDQLNEILLIYGYAEPKFTEGCSKYNNWYIQYPALYF